LVVVVILLVATIVVRLRSRPIANINVSGRAVISSFDLNIGGTFSTPESAAAVIAVATLAVADDCPIGFLESGGAIADNG
jgi:hypothetical protein